MESAHSNTANTCFVVKTIARRRSRRNMLAFQAGDEGRVGFTKLAARNELVDLAYVSKTYLVNSGDADRRITKETTLVFKKRCDNRIGIVTLSNNLTAWQDIKCVAGVRFPVIVNCVNEGLPIDLRTTTA